MAPVTESPLHAIHLRARTASHPSHAFHSLIIDLHLITETIVCSSFPKARTQQTLFSARFRGTRFTNPTTPSGPSATPPEIIATQVPPELRHLGSVAPTYSTGPIVGYAVLSGWLAAEQSMRSDIVGPQQIVGFRQTTVTVATVYHGRRFSHICCMSAMNNHADTDGHDRTRRDAGLPIDGPVRLPAWPEPV
jgi:hypothetical protein